VKPGLRHTESDNLSCLQAHLRIDRSTLPLPDPFHDPRPTISVVASLALVGAPVYFDDRVQSLAPWRNPLMKRRPSSHFRSRCRRIWLCADAKRNRTVHRIRFWANITTVARCSCIYPRQPLGLWSQLCYSRRSEGRQNQPKISGWIA